jgi:DNA-directed RNA polymerase specialized sigma24 family protein
LPRPDPQNKSKELATPVVPADRAILADRALIEACLEGQPGAWTTLYDCFHEPLLAAIRSFLRDASGDLSLIDEIAARVWYALVRSDAELLSRFDVNRGCRLITFLSVLAKSEARQYFRSERRRRTREEKVSRPEMESEEIDLSASTLTHDEFLASLSPSERMYFTTVLTAPEGEDASEEYSPGNTWQLRHRVRKKLNQFLQ